MCITWTSELISFFYSNAQFSPIIFLDVINSLQGVFIFFLFVCLPRPFNIIANYIKYGSDSLDRRHQAQETMMLKHY